MLLYTGKDDSNKDKNARYYGSFPIWIVRFGCGEKPNKYRVLVATKSVLRILAEYFFVLNLPLTVEDDLVLCLTLSDSD